MKIIEKQYFISGLVVVIIITIATSVLLFANNGKAVPLLSIVFLAGCMGGAAANYRRLQAIKSSDQELQSYASQPSFMLQAFVSPLLGGVFAVVSYLIFAAHLVTGTLFPNFCGTCDAYSALKGVFDDVVPLSNGDAVKALVWAFASGFCEKLVPNILDKISEGERKH
jgi:hypothetical protein